MAAKNRDIDSFDRNILKILGTDGRITLTELAARVGLSTTPCQQRVRRLEKDGYILGYRAVLDLPRMGLAQIAFVQVNLSDTRETSLQDFRNAVAGISEIEQCHMIAGGFDYLIKVRTRDIESFRKVLGEKISALPFVAHTSTFMVIETVRD
mgnify:CR=1 FL=1